MMRLRLALTWFCLALLTPVAWAGEESRFLGEAGLPAPLSRVPRTAAQEVRVHIAFPPPGDTPRPLTVRSELKIEHWGWEPAEVEVGFPVTWPWMPAREQPPSELAHSIRPVTAVKLDGEPVPTEVLFYADLAEPSIAGWTAEIARLLGHLPQMYEPDHRAELWRMRPAISLQQRLAELDPQYQPIDLYEELSDEWGHRWAMLSPYNEQLEWASSLGGQGPFGAVVSPVVLEPRTEHTLVVQHKQLPGRDVNHYSSPPHTTRFIAFRYVLTRVAAWGGSRKTTIDITVPDGWGKVVTRPPPTEVLPTKGGTSYRIRMSGSPLEELYVTVVSPRR